MHLQFLSILKYLEGFSYIFGNFIYKKKKSS